VFRQVCLVSVAGERLPERRGPAREDRWLEANATERFWFGDAKSN